MLIVRHTQALQSISLVILTSGFVIRLDVLFKATMLTRGKGVGPGPVVLKGLCALTCQRLIWTVCEGILVVMGSPGS